MHATYLLTTYDTEGLDCAIVASQAWDSAAWCELSPTVLLFEWKHCSEVAYLEARRALERSECQGPPRLPPYRLVMEDNENVIFTRRPREFWSRGGNSN